jgi:cob(I)alamin adenosyltransferase
MSIYTKTGDDGTTSLFGGKRVSKSNLQIEAYGSVDELNSFIGLVLSKIKDKKDKEWLTIIQRDLYQIMVFLSGARMKTTWLGQRLKIFEQYIDKIQSKLPKLNQFIIPQGDELSSWFHVLRTICRRTERNIVRYFEMLKIQRLTLVIKYFNRLSDLFFIMARKYNQEKEILV